MKIRNGFVSNSSSSSFILDRRKLSKDLLYKIEALPEIDTWGRSTGSCSDAQAYVDFRRLQDDDWEDYFTDWVQSWIDTLGNDNVILCRESDEGMGGMFEDVGIDYGQITLMAEDEREYH